jgi:deoxyribonuclease-4
MQMFTQSPRGWMTRVYADQEFGDFRRERAELGLTPIVVHAPYLPNMCTSDEALYQKSLRALKADLERCEKLGAEYLVVHPGAYSESSSLNVGLGRVVNALNEALRAVPGQSRILVENMAGGGRRVGGAFSEIAAILTAVDQQDRIGVCFDTCHALAAGYNLTNKTGVADTLEEFDDEIGLEKIHVFHVNDSKGVRGCHRDMHQHLGKGEIGLGGLRALFSSYDFGRCALILETPKDPVPAADFENLKKLRSIL